MVSIGEHYRAMDPDHPSGVYRVVGTPDDVTLLRVADANGRRRHTGTVLHVSSEAIEASFEPAADPDTGIRPVAQLRNQLQGLYWSVRRFF